MSRQLSIALVLVSMSCGLRSPFGNGANQSTTSTGGQGGTGTSAGAGGAGPASTGSGLPFGSPAGGGAAGSVHPDGPGASGFGGDDATGATGSPGTGAGSGSPAGGGTAGALGHVDGSGVGADPDSSPSGAGGAAATNPFPVDGGVNLVDANAAAAAALFDGGDIQVAGGDAGLATTIVFPDAGVIAYPATPAIPSPLPSAPGTSAAPDDGQPALSHDLNLYTTDGCGEPPACFIRASIVTLSGHAYGGSFSSNYPKDTCARDYIKDDDAFLIGDTFRSAPQAQCTAGTPLISVAFNVDYRAWYLSSRFDFVWTSDDGFRSEWQIANGSPTDNGSYYPIPGGDSRLQFFRVDRLSGETFGQLQVPLLNSDTGTRAVGYLEFDVMVR